MSMDCMDLVTKSLSLPTGLGVGKGGIKLSRGTGHAVPGNACLEGASCFKCALVSVNSLEVGRRFQPPFERW